MLTFSEVAREISIIGGGLAGLTLGILLRREEVPVTIWEAGDYPRNRVCGEFMSGRGGRLLEELGVLRDEPILYSSTVRFVVNGNSTRELRLPEPALCIARRDLDFCLAREFIARGGELRSRERWLGEFSSPGTVRATGRRLASDGAAVFTGIKAHAIPRSPRGGGLEVHFSSSGYAGICPLADGSVNICALLRGAKILPAARKTPAELFRPLIQDALDGAEIQSETFCAVAGVVTGDADWAAGNSEFRLGDSMGVIPPLTGNGMSLAIESAFLAKPMVLAYASGVSDWPRALREYSQSCKSSFGRRLRISSILQKLAFQKSFRILLLSCLKTSPGVLRIFHHFTH